MLRNNKSQFESFKNSFHSSPFTIVTKLFSPARTFFVNDEVRVGCPKLGHTILWVPFMYTFCIANYSHSIGRIIPSSKRSMPLAGLTLKYLLNSQKHQCSSSRIFSESQLSPSETALVFWKRISMEIVGAFSQKTSCTPSSVPESRWSGRWVGEPFYRFGRSKTVDNGRGERKKAEREQKDRKGRQFQTSAGRLSTGKTWSGIWIRGF